MSNTPEVHVSLFDGDYQVTRFVAESSSMNNVYAAAVNLVENNSYLVMRNNYWVEVRGTEGEYLTRVKFNKHTKKYLAGFISEDGYQLEWHEIEAHHILNPSYQFKRIQSL
jgi:hypothetical protein